MQEQLPLPALAVPLVAARKIKKYFPVQRTLLAKWLAGQQDQVVKAVDDVTLQIWPGETVGLVGESGCGKTTLGRVLARLHAPTAGELFFRGQPVTGDTILLPAEQGAETGAPQPVNFFRLTQVIFQNPYSSLNPRKTVREMIGVALRQRGVTDTQAREAEARELLQRVGLSERHLDAYPHQFSGGQRQRIGIARALAMQPQFIIADEPVSSLDVSIQAQVINLLEELQQEFHLTYLFIAHDLSVIYYLSDRVAVMYLGHIVEEAETQRLFDNPLHPYTQALLAAIPTVERGARRERIILKGTVPSPLNPPTGCPFHTRCPVKIGAICEQQRPPDFVVEGRRVACWLYESSGAIPLLHPTPVAPPSALR
ncbi:MAG: ABC transporter ATP-binding protein [Caldilinea sp. CFX5]|nr:ABC transporter ATP-binding protein [Caldilinea sp. CFX5]